MKEYLYNYIEGIENILKKNDKKTDYENLKDKMLIKISFFQHERLIHLLVTLFYAIFTILFIYLSTIVPLFLIICIFLLIFLIFYVIHYFRLENGVQYLYKLYDKVLEKIDNK